MTMPKTMQTLVVMMEPTEDAYDTPLKGGNMILNRFCIDEDAGFELFGVNDLRKSSWELRHGNSHGNRESKRKVKGKEYPFLWSHFILRSLIFTNNSLSSQKERRDKEVINFTLHKISKNVAEDVAEDADIKIHFVYAGYYYSYHDYEDKLKSFILDGMKKNKIKSIMVTSLHLRRWELITHEKMKSFCKGKEIVKDSVNDDLESLFQNIRLGKEPDERVETYFLPKLTQEELELVKRRDPSYLSTFYSPNPDVSDADMKLSESDSKYIKIWSHRRTFAIENSSENSSENSFKNWSEYSSSYSSRTSSENLYGNWSENTSLYSYISGL